MKATLNNLAKRGWYVDLDTPFKFLNWLSVRFREKKFEVIDAVMAKHIESKIRDIERSCLKRHRDRAEVLRAAFKAHGRGEYALSTPVFLAQADGICKELLGVKFYERRKGVPSTAAKARELEMDPISDSILEPLRQAGALNAYEGEMEPNSDIVNRHTVLHGTSLDYGTRENSLRAISLVNYLSAAVSGVQEIRKITPEQIETFKRQLDGIVENALRYQGKSWFAATVMLGHDLLRELFARRKRT